MSTAGIIFSNIHDNNMPELTRQRTVAAVPFACRYRFIDFTLSNMVNSNIYNINVITHCNYRSLVDHIGSGKDWDLARASGGVKILSPYITAYANNKNSLYSSRLDALKSINKTIINISDEYVVLSDCDVICNVDLNNIINDHIENDADMTLAVKRMYVSEEQAANNIIYEADENRCLTDVLSFPTNFCGEGNVSLNIIVMKTEYLQKMVLDAVTHDYTSFSKDIIMRNIKNANYRIYNYEGYFSKISSFADYYNSSMELINNDKARKELFNVKNQPIYTKIKNSPPTYYNNSSNVQNSLIADGCVIEGIVRNSIIFRGVKIGRNSTVMNSVLMQDDFIGQNVYLNSVISDKNTVIRDDCMLSGHKSQPYFIPKGKMI